VNDSEAKEAENNSPPPWIQTRTGKLEPSQAPAGALMLRYKQSSDWFAMVKFATGGFP
jgi:hypothetical protein